MLGCFPDPYPDELLYSVCARYQQRTRFSCSSVTWELFQYTSNNKFILDLPRHLSHLTEKLPQNNSYSAIKFIERNTLLPLYAPFLSRYCIQDLVDEMLEPFSTSNYLSRKDWIRTSKNLRFCSKCVNNDREKFGETYWHRLHQIPYVVLCPEHLDFLRNSDIETRGNPLGHYYYINEYHTADECIPYDVDNNTQKRTFSGSFSDKAFLGMAKNIQWLLDASSLQWSFEGELQSQYISLTAKKLCVEPSKLKCTAQVGRQNHLNKEDIEYKSKFEILRKKFVEYYSIDGGILTFLSCPVEKEKWFPERAAYWTYRILNPEHRWYQNPVKHFLYMNFLGVSLDSLLYPESSF